MMTEKDHLNRVRKFYEENGYAPNCDQIPRGTRKSLQKIYGSWHSVLKEALGFNAAYHKMKIVTNDEIADELRSLKIKLQRVPLLSELPHLKVLSQRFGGPNEALEYAIRSSPRVEILQALKKLTVPFNTEATINEIKDVLHKDGVSYSPTMIQGILVRAFNSNYVTKKSGDRIVLWEISKKGIEFLNQFKGE